MRYVLETEQGMYLTPYVKHAKIHKTDNDIHEMFGFGVTEFPELAAKFTLYELAEMSMFLDGLKLMAWSEGSMQFDLNLPKMLKK